MATHSIDTGVSKPVKQPPQRTSFEEKDQIECQLSELLLDGKSQASESPWASLVLLIKKKDGSWQFCIDYRCLYDASVKDAYPLLALMTLWINWPRRNGSPRWISRWASCNEPR